MSRLYSGNEILRNFGQTLGFKVDIFDDPRHLGPEIKLIENKNRCEIDAIMIYRNIYVIVGINAGKGMSVTGKMEKFFSKLNTFSKFESLSLVINTSAKAGKNIKSKKEKAIHTLNDILAHARIISKEYNIILIKLFFCPEKRIDESIITGFRSDNNILIDKDMYEYLQEVNTRLDKSYMFNDFMHFLQVYKISLEKKGTSRVGVPAKIKSYTVDELPLVRDKTTLYSSSLRVEDIKDYVTVMRVARKYDKRGFQRMVKANRLTKINDEYLASSETFPNNIIIALNPSIYKDPSDFYNEKKNILSLYDEFNSLIIIDGQHRFFSFVKGKKIERFILVTFIYFGEKNIEENYTYMYKIFYKINKKHEKLDPNLSFSLMARIDVDSPEYFWYNVFKQLDKRGFFANRFSFKETTLKKERKKSIVSVIQYGGILRLNTPSNRKGFKVDGLSVFYGRDRDRNVKIAFNIIDNYFSIIEKILHQQNIPKDLLSPREIGSLFRLLRHFMISSKDKIKQLGRSSKITKSTLKKDKSVVKYFIRTLDSIPFKKAINLDYPSSNWAAVEGYMLRKIHRTDANCGNISILSKKGREIYDKTR